jgi:hypothetical protein
MATENTSTDIVILKLEIQEAGGAGGKTPEQAKKAIEGVTTSILGLQQANKKLRDERKLLDTADEKQAARIKEINALLDKNDKTIKANSSSLEKQRLNVGNYTGALDKLVPGLGATVQGIMGMTRASLAFIATPIGAVIAALGVVLAALSTFLKNSTTGMDFLEDAGAAVGAVFNILIDRVTKFVGGFLKIINGDLVAGIKDINGALSGIGDELERDIKSAVALKAALRDLEDAEIDYAIAAAETENQIKKLILQSKNRTLSEKERIALLDEAVKKEKELNESQVALAEESLRIANQTAADRLNISKKSTETEVEFGKRIISELKKDGAIAIDDERDKIKELLIAREQAEGSSIAILEKAQSQKDALEQKAIDEKVKRDEEELKRSEEERERRIEELDLEIERLQYHADLKLEIEKTFLQNRDKEIEKSTAKGIANVEKILDAQRKRKETADKKANDAAKKNRDEDIKGQEAVAEAGTQLLRTAFGRNRAIAIAETIINTVRGMVRALAEYTYPYGAIVAALVGATGSIQTQRLAGINFRQGGQAWGPMFAKGGYFNLGGQRHSNGGTKFIGSDGTRFEAEKDEGLFILKREANREYINSLSGLNKKHGGNSWSPAGSFPSMRTYEQGGQIVTQSNDSAVQQELRGIRTLLATLPPPIVIVEDINSAQQNLENTQVRARVI